jgi:broad specificity phosphatase PhoE
MTDLVLVRHTETAQDPARHPSEWGLTDAGVSRLTRLSTLLSNRGVRSIASSPEGKAMGTARVLAEALGLPLAIAKDFEEQRRSDTQWLSREEFDRLVGEALDTPQSRSFGDESAAEAAARFEAAVRGLPEGGRGALIVSHGRILTAFVARHNRILASAFWKQLEMPAFIVLRAADFVLREVNFDPCGVADTRD